MPAELPAEPATLDLPGATWFGASTDASDPGGPRLVARMVDRAFDSCFGGALVPTSGIAGVTVVPWSTMEIRMMSPLTLQRRSASGKWAWFTP